MVLNCLNLPLEDCPYSVVQALWPSGLCQDETPIGYRLAPTQDRSDGGFPLLAGGA